MKKLFSFLMFLCLTAPCFGQGSSNGNGYDNGLSSSSGGSVTFKDGTHTVSGTQLTVTGGTIGGSTPNATLTVSGGSSANPSATIGLSAVNGTAATFTTSDSAPALSQAISPTWTGNHVFAPSSGNTVFTAGNVGIGTATPGKALDVSGTIRGTAFNDGTNNVTSFVGGGMQLTAGALSSKGMIISANGASSSAAQVCSPMGSCTGTIDSRWTTSAWPLAGTIKNLTFELSTAPVSSATQVVTLWVNGSSTALTCTITGSATSCTDTSDSISVTAGQTVGWKISVSNSPAAASCGITALFIPS